MGAHHRRIDPADVFLTRVRVRVVVICCCRVAAVAIVLTRIVDLSLSPHSKPPSVAGASTVDAVAPGAGTTSPTANGDAANGDVGNGDVGNGDAASADDSNGGAPSPADTDPGDAAGRGGGGGTVKANNQQQGGNPVAGGNQPSPTPGPVVATTSPAPTLSPTSPRVVCYEAESTRNTLTGTRTFTCVPCSDGKKVGDVGDGSVLAFNKVNAMGAGTVTVTLAYVNGDPTSRRAQVSVNGGAAQWLTFPPTGDGNTVGTLTVKVSVRIGDNTIQLGNPGDMAPDFDRLTVREGA